MSGIASELRDRDSAFFLDPLKKKEKESGDAKRVTAGDSKQRRGRERFKNVTFRWGKEKKRYCKGKTEHRRTHGRKPSKTGYLRKGRSETAEGEKTNT